MPKVLRASKKFVDGVGSFYLSWRAEGLMKVEYDPESDILYIQIRDGKRRDRRFGR